MYKKVQLPSVAVVIPAYNEAASIRQLLLQVIDQTQTEFTLQRIVVYSDGSSDETVSQAQSVQDSRIQVIVNEKRGGLAAALNALFAEIDSDVAILLNADIRLADQHVISRLVTPIVHGQADLTSALIEELPARNFFEAVLAAGMEWKKQMFQAWQGGHNFFTCFGPARALSKRLYQTIHIPFGAVDDGYSYLFCKQRGLTFRFVPSAVVQYRLPQNFSDHAKQSFRFAKGIKEIRTLFSTPDICKDTVLPALLVMRTACTQFIRHPITFGLYGVLLIALRSIQPFLKPPDLYRWQIAQTSKTSVHL